MIERYIDPRFYVNEWGQVMPVPVFHLGGEHDQQRHDPTGGSGSGSGSGKGKLPRAVVDEYNKAVGRTGKPMTVAQAKKAISGGANPDDLPTAANIRKWAQSEKIGTEEGVPTGFKGPGKVIQNPDGSVILQRFNQKTGEPITDSKGNHAVYKVQDAFLDDNGYYYDAGSIYVPGKVSEKQALDAAAKASERIENSDITVTTETSGKVHSLSDYKTREITSTHKELWDGLEPSEREAVTDYMWNSDKINGAISEAKRQRGRGGNIDLTSESIAGEVVTGKNPNKLSLSEKKDLATTVENLESALKKAPVFREPVTVWRGSSLDPQRPGDRALLDTINALGAGKKQSGLHKAERTDLITEKAVEVAETASGRSNGFRFRGVVSTSLDPAVASGKFGKADPKIPARNVTVNGERGEGKLGNNLRLTTEGGPHTRINFNEYGTVLFEIEAFQGAYVAPRGRVLRGKRSGRVNTSTGSAAEINFESQEEFMMPFDSRFNVVGVRKNVVIEQPRAASGPRAGKTFGSPRPYTVVTLRQQVDRTDSDGVRRVSTSTGAAFYGLPIGSVIEEE